MSLRRSSLLLLLLSLESIVFAQSDCKELKKLLVPTSSTKAFKLGERIDDNRMLQLGRAHECVNDFAEAARWYRRSADLGNAAAQTNLGALYSAGRGVERDDAEAFRLFLRAASAGFVPAQMNVGIMFGSGRGAKQSDSAAFDWFSRAVSKRYYPAYPALAKQYLYGRGVARDEEKAFALFEEAAKRDVVTGQEYLAWMYSKGHGTKRDISKAIEWNLKAIAAGSGLAANNLGYLYEHGGEGVPPDATEAANWYRVAAERGLPQGEFNLGLLYRDGRGVQKDLLESQRLITAAAEHGFRPAVAADAPESASLK